MLLLNFLRSHFQNKNACLSPFFITEKDKEGEVITYEKHLDILYLKATKYQLNVYNEFRDENRQNSTVFYFVSFTGKIDNEFGYEVSFCLMEVKTYVQEKTR